MIRPRTLLLSAALALLPAALSAQDHRATVFTQLNAAASSVKSNGFMMSTSVGNASQVFGALDGGNKVQLELNLVGGMQYSIIGVCDRDCSDLDLRVRNGDSVVAEDVEVDDVPVLAFRAPSTGRFMLSVEMAQCKADPCYFGYQVFQKR